MRQNGNRSGSNSSMSRFGLLWGAILALLLGACASSQGSKTVPVAETSSTSQSPVAGADVFSADQQSQTPEERYWQLKFALGLTDGIDEELLDALESHFGLPDGTVPVMPDVASYQEAGYRIASSNSILEALADLAAFRAVAGDAMRAEIEQIENDHPERIAALSEELLTEEILIVRSAILDSLESLALEDPSFNTLDLAIYREGTLRARNQLEYVVFAQDMDILADRSIEDTTGRLDAFHRMLDDNQDAEFIRERILATEEMNRQLTDEHREYATRRTLRTLFFLLPAINSYFRYR